jgi:hypothetical protein
MFGQIFGLKKNPFREPRWESGGRLMLPLGTRLPGMSAARETVERTCVYCGSTIEASPRTLAAHCPGCGQHVGLQDLTLHGDVSAERTVTSGNIMVGCDARVSSDLLGTCIHVHGRVMGNIAATDECVVHATGKVAGQIVCRRILVEAGAVLEGTIQRVG